MVGLADLLTAATTHTVGPHFPAKAKHVILLFMTGGPSQVDLFDPKPALAKYAGERPSSVDLRTERTTAGLLPTKFYLQEVRAERAGRQRGIAESRIAGR